MARIRIWIQTKPDDTGRSRYQVMCSEHGPVGDPHELHASAESAQSTHHHDHKAALPHRTE
ncbi:hypothetical protein EF919_38210 [Streptomyces sp. WAC02707]|uniref:hypothetical protein n=1 Tax=Streptomyces sp. WAC02707 TaxID=2487417 RepID=UPI000F76A86A|nr:hypothetical protein [Streptomyces sp. WAC02707]RSS85157.1 hypothetical protein EF919_38210 [Streptomyces sp. WAC02707]